jgi:hypothetical protein
MTMMRGLDARVAVAVAVALGVADVTISPAAATTVGEVNALAEPVYSAATRLAVYLEVYRLSAQDQKIPRDCLLRDSTRIKKTLGEKFLSDTAKSDPTYRDELAEEIIARTIRSNCFAKDANPDSGNALEDYLLVPNFFRNFHESADKVRIVRIAIGTQAAFDILNGEEERGNCIISKFLTEKAPGFAELVSVLKAHQEAITTVEMDIIGLINKHCGLDAYALSQQLYDTAKKVLDEEKQKLDKKIAEEEAKIAEMERQAYKLPDNRIIVENEQGGRWYFEDDSEVPPKLAEHRVPPPPGGWDNPAPFGRNADSIRTILDAMQHNVFVYNGKNTGSARVGISLGSYGYQLERGEDYEAKGEIMRDCEFSTFILVNDERQANSDVSYIDLDCDGALDNVKDKFGKIGDPTNYEHKQYGELLVFLSKLLPVMQAYKSHVQAPNPLTILPDFALEEKNRALMETILGQLDKTSLTTVKDGVKSIKFIGTNKRSLSFVAQFANDYYTTCLFSELTGKDLFRTVDNGCNGSIEMFQRGDQEPEAADTWGMAPVANGMLIDLERFTRFASETFPKSK